MVRSAVIVVLAIAAFVGGLVGAQLGGTSEHSAIIRTGLVNFDLTLVNETSPIKGVGGAIAASDRGVVIARDSLDSSVSFYDVALDRIVPLGFLLPETNRAKVPSRTSSGHRVNRDMVRYQDIHLIRTGDRDRAAVTQTYYDPEQGCFVNRLALAELPVGWWRPRVDGADPVVLGWRSVFETRPCIELSDNLDGAYVGNGAGGRIVEAPGGRLYVSTGDLGHDSLREQPALAQADDSRYGRIWLVDLDGAPPEMISMGHRNPQGMTTDTTGRLWVAEHGPMGGDELNLIKRGANYGWPWVTLGVSYSGVGTDELFWPPNPEQGRHPGFEPPRYAWTPAVAPSSLIRADGLHPRWEGDLLMGTLVAGQLHRLRIDGDAVLVDEAIPLRRRIRDVEVAHGRLYLLFDDGRFGYMAPRDMQEAPADAVVSALKVHGCMSCHSNPSAPQLENIVGRRVASQPGTTFSDALKRFGGVWTRERLARFIDNPQGAAPGSLMPATALTHEAMARILDELESSEAE